MPQLRVIIDVGASHRAVYLHPLINVLYGLSLCLSVSLSLSLSLCLDSYRSTCIPFGWWRWSLFGGVYTINCTYINKWRGKHNSLSCGAKDPLALLMANDTVFCAALMLGLHNKLGRCWGGGGGGGGAGLDHLLPKMPFM